MNFDLSIRYEVEKEGHPHNAQYLCFTCAVAYATQGIAVKPVMDDYTSENYIGSNLCVSCQRSLNLNCP